jgi:hypothetical protein
MKATLEWMTANVDTLRIINASNGRKFVKPEDLVSSPLFEGALISSALEIEGKSRYKTSPKAIVGRAIPINEPRHPKAVAVAAAISGVKKKQALPPII